MAKPSSMPRNTSRWPAQPQAPGSCSTVISHRLEGRHSQLRMFVYFMRTISTAPVAR